MCSLYYHVEADVVGEHVRIEIGMRDDVADGSDLLETGRLAERILASNDAGIVQVGHATIFIKIVNNLIFDTKS